ncbi:hypothetical protein Fcan01_16496 [Folsomia candida]|uniref:Uncharacterized protein n=1 Tax=Folsomia candida TaxID=158441 RepID=A0A226DUA3_FOLCA|nr:hypothetical protein Fcan01_16496 [Folsomia candida]
MVQSLLFGQAIADEIIKKVKNKRISRPLLATWFFVCYILMDNLYQGSIYSDLTVVSPPQVPKTIEELVASNMTIITTSRILKSNKIEEGTSLLKTYLIPEIFNKNFSERFNKLVKKMNSKLEYIHGGTEDVSMVKNMSKSCKVRSNKTSKWISTKETFAIMDTTFYLQLCVDSLHILGTRLVVKNNADVSLGFSTLSFGRRNFISPKIRGFLRHLSGTGILGRFKFLHIANHKIYFIKGLNSNSKGAKLVYESWNENDDEKAIGALWYVLALCSLVVTVATAIFMWEIVSAKITIENIKLRQMQLSTVRMVGIRLIKP